MKTATLTLKRKVLVIEPSEETRFKKYVEYLVTHDTEHLFLLPKGKWKCLGSPDDLKEEDVKDLVKWFGRMPDFHQPLSYVFYDYVNEDYGFKTAIESFNSALEKEIYWVNPLNNKLDKSQPLIIQTEHLNKWNEAQKKTFDITQTLIFIEN